MIRSCRYAHLLLSRDRLGRFLLLLLLVDSQNRQSFIHLERRIIKWQPLFTVFKMFYLEILWKQPNVMQTGSMMSNKCMLAKYYGACSNPELWNVQLSKGSNQKMQSREGEHREWKILESTKWAPEITLGGWAGGDKIRKHWGKLSLRFH